MASRPSRKKTPTFKVIAEAECKTESAEEDARSAEEPKPETEPMEEEPTATVEDSESPECGMKDLNDVPEALKSAYLAYGDVFLTKKPRTRKELTIEDKVKVIERSWTGMSERQIAKEFSISKTAVHTALIREKEILEEYISGGGARKRKCRSTYSMVDFEVWQWYQNLAMRCLPVSGAMIQRKARQIAAQNGLRHFKGSNGWLDSFKRRHNIGSTDMGVPPSSISAYMQPLFNTLVEKESYRVDVHKVPKRACKQEKSSSELNTETKPSEALEDQDEAEPGATFQTTAEKSSKADSTGNAIQHPHLFGLPLLANLVSYKQHIEQVDSGKQEAKIKKSKKKVLGKMSRLNSAKPTGVVRKPMTLIAKKTAQELSVAEELAAMATRLTPEQAKLAEGLTEMVRKYCQEAMPYESTLQIQGELCVVYDDNATTAIFNDRFTKPTPTAYTIRGKAEGSAMSPLTPAKVQAVKQGVKRPGSALSTPSRKHPRSIGKNIDKLMQPASGTFKNSPSGSKSSARSRRAALERLVGAGAQEGNKPDEEVPSDEVAEKLEQGEVKAESDGEEGPTRQECSPTSAYKASADSLASLHQQLRSIVETVSVPNTQSHPADEIPAPSVSPSAPAILPPDVARSASSKPSVSMPDTSPAFPTPEVVQPATSKPSVSLPNTSPLKTEPAFQQQPSSLSVSLAAASHQTPTLNFANPGTPLSPFLPAGLLGAGPGTPLSPLMTPSVLMGANQNLQDIIMAILESQRLSMDTPGIATPPTAVTSKPSALTRQVPLPSVATPQPESVALLAAPSQSTMATPNTPVVNLSPGNLQDPGTLTAVANLLQAVGKPAGAEASAAHSHSLPGSAKLTNPSRQPGMPSSTVPSIVRPYLPSSVADEISVVQNTSILQASGGAVITSSGRVKSEPLISVPQYVASSAVFPLTSSSQISRAQSSAHSQTPPPPSHISLPVQLATSTPQELHLTLPVPGGQELFVQTAPVKTEGSNKASITGSLALTGSSSRGVASTMALISGHLLPRSGLPITTGPSAAAVHTMPALAPQQSSSRPLSLNTNTPVHETHQLTQGDVKPIPTILASDLYGQPGSSQHALLQAPSTAAQPSRLTPPTSQPKPAEIVESIAQYLAGNRAKMPVVMSHNVPLSQSTVAADNLLSTQAVPAANNLFTKTQPMMTPALITNTQSPQGPSNVVGNIQTTSARQSVPSDTHKGTRVAGNVGVPVYGKSSGAAADAPMTVSQLLAHMIKLKGQGEGTIGVTTINDQGASTAPSLHQQNLLAASESRQLGSKGSSVRSKGAAGSSIYSLMMSAPPQEAIHSLSQALNVNAAPVAGPASGSGNHLSSGLPGRGPAALPASLHAPIFVTQQTSVSPVPHISSLTQQASVSSVPSVMQPTSASPVPILGSSIQRPSASSMPHLGGTVPRPSTNSVPILGSSVQQPSATSVPLLGSSVQGPSTSSLPLIGSSVQRPSANSVPLLGSLVQQPSTSPVPLMGSSVQRSSVSSLPNLGILIQQPAASPVPRLVMPAPPPSSAAPPSEVLIAPAIAAPTQLVAAIPNTLPISSTQNTQAALPDLPLPAISAVLSAPTVSQQNNLAGQTK